MRRFYADEHIIMPQACARSLPASTPWNGHVHRIVIKFTGTLAARCTAFSSVAVRNNIFQVVKTGELPIDHLTYQQKTLPCVYWS